MGELLNIFQRSKINMTNPLIQNHIEITMSHRQVKVLKDTEGLR